MAVHFAAQQVREASAAWRHRADVLAVLERFSGNPFRKLQRVHAKRFNAKYLNTARWIPKTFRRVFRLGLHRAEPLDILDIGTGCGYFPLICNYYGHRAVGTDLGGDPLYGAVLSYLRQPLIPWRIEPFRPGPRDIGDFDLITAFMVAFNTPRRSPWGPEEWGFWLDDVATHLLRPAGRLELVLNRQADGSFGGPELQRLFHRRGGEVEGSRVHFPLPPRRGGGAR